MTFTKSKPLSVRDEKHSSVHSGGLALLSRLGANDLYSWSDSEIGEPRCLLQDTLRGLDYDLKCEQQQQIIQHNVQVEEKLVLP